MHSKCSLSVLCDYSSLEKFLKEEYGISRSQIKKYNLSKSFLNKKLLKKDSLEIPYDLLNPLQINPNYLGPEIKILHEDESFIVFNKPYGVHGHPQQYEENDSLLNFMRSNGLGEYLKINPFEYERGLLYRLDHVTSGVLIYIKNQSLYKELRESFKLIAKEKIYLAIVKGNFSKSGEYTHYFSSKGKAGQKMQAHESQGELTGSACFEKIEYNNENDLSLVKVKLFTGLRHQIRSQLAELGFPILGDVLYGGESSSRVFLHAYQYSLEWNQNKLSIRAEDAPLFDGLISLNHDSIL